MTTAHLIYNPYAGRLTSESAVQNAAKELSFFGWQVKIFQSESGKHTTELAREAAQAGVDVLVVAGGDGSIERVVTGLVGSETALGVLPAGTANVWAQEIGMPIPGIAHNRSALEDAARLLAQGRVRKVDVGLCNENPFLLWAGAGIDAEVVHRVEPRRRWQKHLGAPYYAASAVAQASLYKGLELRVEVNGTEFKDRFLLAVLSNIRLYAGGLAKLSHDAVLDDGLMELWLFHGDSINDLIRHVGLVLAGKHHDSEKIHLISTDQVFLEAGEPIYVHLDGEPFEVGNRVHLKVFKRELNIVTPPQVPQSLFSRT